METITLAIDVSEDGRRNAFYHLCKVVERDVAYAACLNKITIYKTGNLPANHSDCERAMRHGRCPAVEMRQQEFGAGRALFFKERIRGIASLVDKAKKLFTPASIDQLTQAEPPAPVPIVGKDYVAAALNSAIAKEQKAKVEVRPGETMLEAARRMLAARKAD
jgi:hypothetical protein